jgi:mannose-1-phosphate guanylyltransferase
MTSPTIVPVILCGGSGTRLWPASREQLPKQFLPLIDDRSLLQNTLLRALYVAGAAAKNVVTVTHASLTEQVRFQLASITPAAAQHILSEPCARNTAAAVAYAAAYAQRIFGEDALLWILPADHYIGNEDEMTKAFLEAAHAAESGHLVTFGIRPTRPETGYGYLRLGTPLHGNVYRAAAFVEKPNAPTAASYVADGHYLWNSGMFLFEVATLLNEYKIHAPDVLKQSYLAMDTAANPAAADESFYSKIPEMPFDKAIMEKSARVAVVPCDPAWSDIGSWESLWEIGEKDAAGNVIAGNAVCAESQGCLIHAQKRLITLAGVENIVVIDTGDAVLIANRSDGDAMRSLVRTLKGGGYAEISRPAPTSSIAAA